jgi:hypothetical protein
MKPELIYKLVETRPAEELRTERENKMAAQSKTKPLPEEEFDEVFRGLGLFNRQYSMRLKNGAIPVQMPVRKVPIAKRASLKQALKEMEAMKVIQKVDHETPWS